jgi:hypothetical protein
MSQKSPPHPWHEGLRPQNAKHGAVVESSNASQSATPRKNRASHRHHRNRRGSTATTSSSGQTNKSSRLWQLPEDSIAGYYQWIQEKPEADQTPAERRFLWKYMVRHLGVKQNERKARQFVDELQLKPNHTVMEETFLKQYRRRRQDRNGKSDLDKTNSGDSKLAEDTVIVWERPAHRHDKKKGQGDSGHVSSGPTSSLKGLRESMEKLGLSLEKLKEPLSSNEDILME